MDDEFVFTLTMNASVVSASYGEYEAGEAQAVAAQRQADESMSRSYAQSLRTVRSMDRALMMGMHGASMLGMALPGMHGVLGGLQKSAYAMAMAYGAYNLYRGILNAKIAWKQIEAATETIAAAAAQNWWAIAVAGAASAAVYEAFKQPVHLNIDWTSSRGRRQMRGSIAGSGG